MNLEAKMYDVEGNEIQVPDGHSVFIGKNRWCFVKTDGPSCEFVYKPPNENDPKYQLAKKFLNE